MKQFFSFIILIVLVSACHQPTPYNKDAIELNNKAVTLLERNPDSALKLLDRAFALDTSYLLPLQNKINLLIKLEDYQKGIDATDQLLHKLNVPEIWQMKGLLKDKINDSLGAKEAYENSLTLFKKQLYDGKSNNKYASQYQIGMSMILLGQVEEGKKLVEKNGSLAQLSKDKLARILAKINNHTALVEELLQ